MNVIKFDTLAYILHIIYFFPPAVCTQHVTEFHER